jgi:hypothetical protein
MACDYGRSNLPTMMVRCVVGAMTRRSPRRRCCVLPAIADGRDGVGRRTWPVPSRFAIEPAVTDRPLLVGTPTRTRAAPSELHPGTAAAQPLRLRTRHTALCYVPFNEGGRERNRGYVVVTEPSPDTPVGLPCKTWTSLSLKQCLSPTSPALVGFFCSSPSAGIDGGTISSYAGCWYASPRRLQST